MNQFEWTPSRFREAGMDAIAHPEKKGILPLVGMVLRARLAEEKDRYPNYEAARDVAARIKDHTLHNLDHYLEMFEAQVIARGGTVHYARNSEEACQIVLGLCARAGAQTVTRSKSMLGEEIGLPEALDKSKFERVETDLGEHIIQLKNDPPSHIVGPAMHVTIEDVRALFEAEHAEGEDLSDPQGMVKSARNHLRAKFLTADVGISGANFLVADQGAVITVTNEGNAELTCQVPRTHIVTAGLEKMVPSMDHASVLLRLLARSALGIDLSQYTTVWSGPKRDEDHDGPENFHVVLVDNHRTELLGTALEPILRCIRCGACLNSCPVYEQVGGHAYGFAYQGPMGSVLTPSMTSLAEAGDLPQACTLNGRCAEVCPVKIPLPDLIREMRVKLHEAEQDSPMSRIGFKVWGWIAARPWAYRVATRLGVTGLMIARRMKAFDRLPMLRGWTKGHDLPKPEGGTFMSRYKGGER